MKFDNYYDALQKLDCIGPQVKASKEVAKWAFNVVTTRSFGEGNEMFIAPMGDMVRNRVRQDFLHWIQHP